MSNPRNLAAAPPSLDDFVLAPAGKDLPERVDRLDAVLPKRGVQKILDEANRQGVTGCRPTVPEDPKPETPVRSFCFEPGDNDTTAWYPQGVTTVADAQQDEQWGDRKALLVSWYDHNRGVEKGVRVSFIDPETDRYQHVLLVYPYEGAAGPTYEAVTTPQRGDGRSVHGGGIVWYGNYLYVSDTRRGIRVFDMRYIMDLKSAGNGDTTDQNTVGLHDGRYHGFGYRYVMPQVGTWEHPDGPAEFPPDNKCATGGPPKFSYLSLDRSTTPDMLISGEYCAAPAGPDLYGRVAQWEMDGDTGLPRTGADGRWRAATAYRLPKSHVQGATSVDGRWFLSSTGGGPEGAGHLQAARADGTGTGVLTVDAPERDVAAGVEDLSYWPGTDELWTVTEHPGSRILYSLRRD